MGVDFEWDPNKASQHLRKHGVTFEEAATVFRDDLGITVPDPDHSTEDELLSGYDLAELLKGRLRGKYAGRYAEGTNLVLLAPDYDLAVLIEPSADGPRLRAALAHELSQALGVDAVDVVLLNRLPIELAYAIIAQGTVLFEQDVATRIEYEADVLSRYADYLPVLRTQRDDIL